MSKGVQAPAPTIYILRSRRLVVIAQKLLPKREYVGSSRDDGALAAYGNLELCGRQRRDTRRK